MKHDPKITAILIAIFVLTQIFGLYITSAYLEPIADDASINRADMNASFKDLPLGLDRPEVEQDYSFIYILFGILFGTIILLILARYKKRKAWKIWYLFAVVMAMTVVLSAFMDQYLALIIASLLGSIKIYRMNPIIHNVTEIMIYSGIAVIFVPILNIFSATILLLLISVYDAYAVWKSKHMIRLAKFQSSSGLFAGLSIPYDTKSITRFYSTKKADKPSDSQKGIKEKQARKDIKRKQGKNAILGGGDMAFPLLFSGAVLHSLITGGTPLGTAFLKVSIISSFAAIAISLLFIYGKKDRFYPAMPFISAGCFLGYAVMLII